MGVRGLGDERKPAVVLLSGGLDSATVLAIAKREGYEVFALSFAYGQRHGWELEAARRVAEAQGATEHKIATIDLRVFGGSALTDDIDVPKGRAMDEMAQGIPITYVPAWASDERSSCVVKTARPSRWIWRSATFT